MKNLIVPLLLIQGCSSSWKQKDFKKDLEKATEQEAKVEVTEELRDKFQVEEVPALKEEKKTERSVAPVKKSTPTLVSAPKKAIPVKLSTKKNTLSPSATPQVVAPKIPVDYPAEISAINEKAKKVWDTYVPKHTIGEKVYLDIHYLGMTVGKIMFTNKGKRLINGQEVWHFHARFKSAPFYSNIYELDDTVDTYVTTSDFLSVRYSLIQRESKQDVDDLQLHDRDKLKTFWFYKQKKVNGEVKEKQKEAFIPYFSIDPFSILFLYQGLPLNNGDVMEIPIMNKAKIMILKSVVEGRETIETSKGKRKAIRVHATTQYSGHHLKSGDIYLWFNDDDKRLLLKARAKIKIGSVTADIVED